MGLKHAAAIVLIGALIMWVPWAFLVFLTEAMNGSFLAAVAAYIIIVSPIMAKFADMANEAVKGADD